MSITVVELTPVIVHRVRANRADSGAPLWKSFHFISVPDAEHFASQNECCGEITPVHALYQFETDTYFIAK